MADVLPFERASDSWVARKLNFRSARYRFQIALAEWLDLHDRSGAHMTVADLLASPNLVCDTSCILRTSDTPDEGYAIKFSGARIDATLMRICMDAAHRNGDDGWPAAFAFMTHETSKTNPSTRREAHVIVLPFVSRAPDEGRIVLVIAEWDEG